MRPQNVSGWPLSESLNFSLDNWLISGLISLVPQISRFYIWIVLTSKFRNCWLHAFRYVTWARAWQSFPSASTLSMAKRFE
jgi:hypothetical protein